MEKNQRPILRIPRSSVEIALEIAAVAGILFMILFLLLSWPHLPERIPHHFGVSGTPDAWGGKGMMFMLPTVGVILYLGLSVLSRYPHIFNYPWPITDQNAERQYYFARLLLGWMKTEIVWLFSFIEWETIQVAMNRAEGLGKAFLPTMLIIIFGTISVFLLRAFRAR